MGHLSYQHEILKNELFKTLLFLNHEFLKTYKRHGGKGDFFLLQQEEEVKFLISRFLGFYPKEICA
jgi:hypothetical protein